MEYLTIAIGICWFLIQFIQGWYSHSSINSEKMHKSEWTILWSGWDSQEKISLKKLTQENLENSELKGLKKILFPFEKFYPKKKLKFWKVQRRGRLTKKIFFFKYSLKVFLNISETQTFLPFIEKGEKGSLSCKFHHAVMKKNLEAKQSNWHAILSSIFRK